MLMCLDVDCDFQTLSDGTRRARKEHRCKECTRTIAPGETYRFWATIQEWGFEVQKMCAHCWATIEVGAAIAHCPKAWFWDMVFDLDPDEGGFVGDIIANHELTPRQRAVMRQCARRGKRQWRREDGTLYPIPHVPTQRVRY